MARRKSSGFEAFVFLASKLPWWLALPFAVASYLALHQIAITPVSVRTTSAEMTGFMLGTVLRTFATFLQYLVPLILAVGALINVLNRRKRMALLDHMTPTASGLEAISWQEFELLVGEAFRRQGFVVEETANGPDGGVDLVLRRHGEKHLVQCKQWRATKVSVMVVRELFGVMAASGAVGGFVVTSGRFTQEARDFASGRNVRLVDGAQLARWVKESKTLSKAQESNQVIIHRVEPVLVENSQLQPADEMSCPVCCSTMVLRTARKGPNPGKRFWGCVRYPQCRATCPEN
jgi:restriction system protein